MIYIAISVFCSVFVAVLLKLAKRYGVDIRQAIAWNYSIAAFMTWLFFKPSFPRIDSELYSTYLALGVLLPGMFLVLGQSVKHAGIVVTDIAQRLSLFIPVIAAFLIFNESLNPQKLAGLGLAFLAILLMIPGSKKGSSAGIYPLIVFLGMGVIDVLFKQLAKDGSNRFTDSLLLIFVLAFILSICSLGWLLIRGRARFSLYQVICGWILGAANFGNILFYLKAHQALAKSPSLVFSSMNIGVIVLGSLAGAVLFKEKITKARFAGILIAIVAVLLMASA